MSTVYRDDLVTLIHGDAARLSEYVEPESVDLIVTSPPYFALRSYQDACHPCHGTGDARWDDAYDATLAAWRAHTSDLDDGVEWPPRPELRPAGHMIPCRHCNGTGQGHYEGQIGSEPTPTAFLEALWAVTAECVKVLRPTGSLWVNLGDKYSQRVATRHSSHQDGLFPDRPELRKDWKRDRELGLARMPSQNVMPNGLAVPEKSLMGLPWRYAIGCIDRLGLILRAHVVWDKPNGLPESVTDRVRRSHEDWFHMTKQGRYFAAVDEVREASGPDHHRTVAPAVTHAVGQPAVLMDRTLRNPLGKLPGSVWRIPSEPLSVPDSLGIEHFAAFPTEWPRRIISGWCPTGYCVECGEARRPVVEKDFTPKQGPRKEGNRRSVGGEIGHDGGCSAPGYQAGHIAATITGYACACPTPDAPTRPAVVLDPFVGTGTVPLVASVLGRHGIGVDLSRDYLRLAEWRVNDPAQRAKVVEKHTGVKPAVVDRNQLDLFGGVA